MAITKTTKGVAAGVGAAVLWASGGVAAKYIMVGGLDPFTLTQARMAAAGIIVIGWLAVRRPRALRIKWRDYFYFAFLGSVGLAGVTGSYLAAINRIQVAAAILLQYLAPAVIALIAWAFMGERMTKLKLLALGLAFGGCYLSVGGYNLELLSLNKVGVLWGLVAAATFVLYSLTAEYGLRTYGPWTVLAYGLGFAGLTWSVGWGATGIFILGSNWSAWLAFAWFVILSTVISFGLFFYAVDQIRATRASIAALAEPIAGGLLAFLFLGEKLTPLQMLGGAGVVVAVGLIAWERGGEAPAANLDGGV